jgi:hypothetical protein
MEKKCIVIMPLGDQDGYAKGHFNRVYDYIIVPACKQAGYSPVKVDDQNTTGDNAWDLTKSIVDTDIAICDVSAGVKNVLYAFSIRHALTLPVTVIKDLKTLSNVQEFGALEYDESLRIDTVQNEIQTISEALLNSVNTNADTNSLLSRLRIGPGQVSHAINIEGIAEREFIPLELTEEVAKPENLLPMISPVPDFVGEPFSQQDVDSVKAGNAFFHMAYGKGEIKTIKDMPAGRMAQVRFDSGVKMLVLKSSTYFRKMND